VREVAGGGDVASSLGRAVQARVIEIRERHINFVHPLLASAIYSSATPETRRETHRFPQRRRVISTLLLSRL
jgi:hypothetical protein